MKAPDTIYIPFDEPRFSWRSMRQDDTDIEYIRTSANIGNVTTLQGRVEYLKGTVEDLKRAGEAQKAEIARLHLVVSMYATHRRGCDAEQRISKGCTCGLNAALTGEE